MELPLLLVFCAVAALMLALSNEAAAQPLRLRLARLRTRSPGHSEDSGGILAQDSPGLAGRLLAALGGRGDPKRASIPRTQRRLMMAGLRRPSSLHIYLGSRIALALGLAVLALNAAPSLDSLRLTALLVFAGGVGMTLPSLLLDKLIKRRQYQMELGLPDALDVMVVCVEAGLGLNSSIARVASEYSRPVLAEEFELVVLETRAGRSNVSALRGLADRTGLAEVAALVAMLVQTERFGTSVADALRVHAEAMRSRRMQRAEEGAAKAPLKMLLPAGVFIFPATLLVIAGPGMIRLIATLQGS